MKILHIINNLSRNGGAQRFVIDLVTNVRVASETKILIVERENDFVETLNSIGVDVLIWCEMSLKQKISLIFWPSVVHSHLFPSCYLALLFFKSKKIQTEHNSHNRRRDYFFLKPFEWLMYNFHDKTVCISHKVKEQLSIYVKIDNSKLEVIYNGVDLERFSSDFREFPKDNSRLYIGMAGRLHEYKDQETLILAMKLIPKNYHLLLAGEGDQFSRLKELVNINHLNDRVTFLGLVSNVPEFLSKLHIYIQSSKIEGFGLAVVEAMASRVPVLGSRVPGLDEVIGSNEYLFELGDEEEIYIKLMRIFSSRSKFKQASIYSHNRSIQFELNKFISSYENLYCELSNV
ncbi:glycosyltransferase [Vibrio chagasii]|uniref:glycosyltransferase n=1 Tax=Vibrio chagasii TaxID=170679 RepID=UPI003DA8F6CA